MKQIKYKISDSTSDLDEGGWHEIDGEQKCLHESCPECHGTGTKRDGSMCVHMISCPCPKCNASF